MAAGGLSGPRPGRRRAGDPGRGRRERGDGRRVPRDARAGAVDIVQPSPTKVGGLGETQEIAALAAAAHVAIVPHSFYFGPGLAAALHLAAATPGVPWVEWPMGELATPLLEAPIRPVGGWLAPLARPRARRAPESAKRSGVIPSAPRECPCSRPCNPVRRRRPRRGRRRRPPKEAVDVDASDARVPRAPPRPRRARRPRRHRAALGRGPGRRPPVGPDDRPHRQARGGDDPGPRHDPGLPGEPAGEHQGPDRERRPRDPADDHRGRGGDQPVRAGARRRRGARTSGGTRRTS